jgi:fatty-acyl-CoA synthase
MHMPEITIVYGQTEASPGCTMSHRRPARDRVATVGTPAADRVQDRGPRDRRRPARRRVTGEFVRARLQYHEGLLQDARRHRAAIDKDGWLHTGDLACRDKEGYYRITGRLKDMIIRGGENIYPKEIEEFIYTHPPKVKDVQVIGVPDEQYGEEIMACVILKACISSFARRVFAQSCAFSPSQPRLLLPLSAEGEAVSSPSSQKFNPCPSCNVLYYIHQK